MSQELLVQDSEFTKAIKNLVGGASKNLQATARLSFREGMLELSLAEMSVRLPADGEWPPQVFLAGQGLKNLGTGKAGKGSAPLGYDGEKVSWGDVSVKALGEDDPNQEAPSDEIGKGAIRLPANPPWDMVLSIRLRYSDDELMKSGLASLYMEAEEKRDLAMVKALKALEPLNISEQELRAFVDDTIRARYVGR